MYINGQTRFITFSVLFLICINSEVILQRGWVKHHNKGQKIPVYNLTYFDPAFVNDTKYLRISGRISTLPNGSIKNFLRVVTLRISSCGIKEVKPGAFVNLCSLKTLSLKENDIEKIEAGVFTNLTITLLFLHKNQISYIHQDAFNDMPNLTVLKLNSNQISTWDSNWFRNTPQLTELFFRRNQISHLPKGAFKHLKGGHYASGTYIVDTKLYLSKNGISSIDPNAFSGIQELKQLWLDRNELEEIPATTFTHMSHIGVIFLSKNQLKSLPDSLFSSFQENLLTLDVTRNHNLSCLSYNIVSRVNITTLNDINKLNCSCVSDLIKKLEEAKKYNEIKSDCGLVGFI